MVQIYTPGNLLNFKLRFFKDEQTREMLEMAKEAVINMKFAQTSEEADAIMTKATFTANALCNARYEGKSNIALLYVMTLAIEYATFRQEMLMDLMDGAPENPVNIVEDIIMIPQPPVYIQRTIRLVTCDLMENNNLVLWSPIIIEKIVKFSFELWDFIDGYTVTRPDGIISINSKKYEEDHKHLLN